MFLADTTIRRNVALGVPEDEIDQALVTEAIRLAQLEDFVASLQEGLDSVVGQRGVRLSGGQRQRLAIARALYRRPSVLMFDEGTSALDSVTESELLKALVPLRGKRTIIVVAHRLSTVAASDRAILVDDGRLVDIAPRRARGATRAAPRNRPLTRNPQYPIAATAGCNQQRWQAAR